MKKIIVALMVWVSAVAPVAAAEVAVNADAAPVTVSVFVRDDCKHCRALEAFLADYVPHAPRPVEVRRHNLAEAAEHAKFVAIAQKFGLPQGTPIVLVGTTIFQGFDSAATTGAMLARLAERARTSTTFDAILAGTAPPVTVGSAIGGATCSGDMTVGCDTSDFTVRLSLIGTEVSLATMSLAAVSLTLGFVDGFNPCAMWVLVVFLTLLLQTGSRRRMVEFAGLFILAEALMYWAILLVWFSAWDFIGLSRIVTPLVGALSLGSGAYFLYKFATWKPVCSVSGAQEQEKLTARMQRIANKPLTWAVALGIIGLAFSVNIFEFACSIGIPQAYTKILELNHLSFWQTQWQMFLYIVMYMIDDVVVFALALWGVGRLSDTMKYSRWTTLVGGVLMLVLGALMIFAPEALVL